MPSEEQGKQRSLKAQVKTAWGGEFSGFFFVWGCPHALCMQKEALALAESGCLPAPPGHVQVPGAGEAAQRWSMPCAALPVPDGNIHSSFRGGFLKKQKGFSRDKPD